MHVAARWVVVVFAAFASVVANPTKAADNEHANDVRNIVEKNYAHLESLYQDLHRAPELSLVEVETSKRIAAELRDAGYEVNTGVGGGTGVVAVLRNGPGKTLLIRADLDGLPVKEETGAPYASTATRRDAAGAEVSLMHACGHDVHMTCLVGTARTLAELRDRWTGTLILIGQPAEEIVAGAAAMLKDGLYTRFPRPDWALALHVDAGSEAGKVGYVSGAAMAGVESVDITVRGVGGHGAYPNKTKDPIVIAAQTILGLQTISSREVDPLKPVVVTVGSIHGGTKRNIIPDEVTMLLTVRAYDDAVRAQTLAAIKRIVEGTAKAAGVPEDRMPVVTVRAAESSPVLVNAPELVTRVTGVFRGVLGEANVVERDPVMASEDFGHYAGRDGDEPRVPIFMVWLGAVAPDRMAASKQDGAPPLPGLHSSKFLPEPTKTIRTGVVAMSSAALDLLKKSE